MTNVASSSFTALALLVTMVMCPVCQSGHLKTSFYKKSCPSAEDTVKQVVQKHISQDPTLAAGLLRMHFHDCFVRGCDGSVLINSTTNNTAEKDAIPNRRPRGFEVIDDAKAEVEKSCPGIVSCADILSLAARDAVVAASGGPSWRLKTGRRDGVISNASEVRANLPSSLSNFTTLKEAFARKGLDVKDLVVLSGGHTIGIAHCPALRLYNYSGKGDLDPSLNTTYAQQLKRKCTSFADNITTVEMDSGSSLSFDSHYFMNLKQQKGLFQSDAALLTDSIAAKIIDRQLNQNVFFHNFKKSIQRMSEIQVLTGSAGEIRNHCAIAN